MRNKKIKLVRSNLMPADVDILCVLEGLVLDAKDSCTFFHYNAERHLRKDDSAPPLLDMLWLEKNPGVKAMQLFFEHRCLRSSRVLGFFQDCRGVVLRGVGRSHARDSAFNAVRIGGFFVRFLATTSESIYRQPRLAVATIDHSRQAEGYFSATRRC